MKTTNENKQFNHNLKPARPAFLAALMLITSVAAVTPAAAQSSLESARPSVQAAAVPLVSPNGGVAPNLASAYCTYSIHGSYFLTCYWSAINANSSVMAAISEYSGTPTNRFIGSAQMQVYNIAPFNGGVTVWVNVNWGSNLPIRLDLTTNN